MGLIRKTLAVGTLGAVSGSSKKQRVAAAQLRTQQAILAELRHAVGTATDAPPPPYTPSSVPVTSPGGASWLDDYRRR